MNVKSVVTTLDTVGWLKKGSPKYLSVTHGNDKKYGNWSTFNDKTR